MNTDKGWMTIGEMIARRDRGEFVDIPKDQTVLNRIPMNRKEWRTNMHLLPRGLRKEVFGAWRTRRFSDE